MFIAISKDLNCNGNYNSNFHWPIFMLVVLHFLCSILTVTLARTNVSGRGDRLFSPITPNWKFALGFTVLISAWNYFLCYYWYLPIPWYDLQDWSVVGVADSLFLLGAHGYSGPLYALYMALDILVLIVCISWKPYTVLIVCISWML